VHPNLYRYNLGQISKEEKMRKEEYFSLPLLNR
jgi:hypothetical protein